MKLYTINTLLTMVFCIISLKRIILDYLILVFIGFIAALTPGPDIFYIIRQGLCNGKENAFKAVFGILTGNIIYLSLVGFGLSKIGHNAFFQMIVGFLGGVYLIKIAYFTFKEKIYFNQDCKISKNIYKEAMLLNLSNPKAMIFFAIIITPFLSKNIMLSLIGLFTGIACAFSLAALISSKLKLEEKILNIINKIASVIFIIFAIKLFLIAFKALHSL